MNWIWSFFLTASILVSWVCALPAGADQRSNAREAHNLRYKGQQALKRRSYGVAESCFKQALRLEPSNYFAHYSLARVYERTKQWRASLDHYKSAARIKPSKSVELAVADMSLKAGDLGSAAYAYDRVLKSYSVSGNEEVYVLRKLGYLCIQLKRHREAAKHYRRLTEINPRDPRYLLLLGDCQQNAGNLKLAYRTFSTYLKRFPQDREASRLKHRLKKLQSISKPASFLGKWRTQPIKVYLADAPKGVEGYRKNYRALVGRAFKVWQEASHLVSFEFVDKAGADITITWSGNARSIRSKQEPAAIGLTKFTRDSKGYMIKATVSLLCINPVTGKPYRDRVLESIATHEIGHALGLPHSRVRQDVMYPWETNDGTNAIVLTARDLGMLKTLYTYQPIQTTPTGKAARSAGRH